MTKPENPMVTRHYGQIEFSNDCLRIAAKLHADGYYPDHFVALDRGGVIAAATIRRNLQDLAPGRQDWLVIKYKQHSWNRCRPFNYEFHDWEARGFTAPKVLLVDDIIDYGLQFEKAALEIPQCAAVQKFGIEVRTAALIWNESNQCKIKPDYYADYINKEENPRDNAWVRFWWEND